MNFPKCSLTIITVTLNCQDKLPRLIASLRSQTDQDFRWVVADGGSTDNTLAVIESFPDARRSVVSEPDFGIYHALNKALLMVQTEWYLVAGADDELYPQSIEAFKQAVRHTECDILAAAVDCNGSTMLPMRGKTWLRGGNGLVASHSVGTFIKRSLHDRVGYYSNRYVNCADMYFVLKAVQQQNARIEKARFTAGAFGSSGISSVDHLCSLSDAFRIQIALGRNSAFQSILYILRLIRAVAVRSYSERPDRKSKLLK